MRDKVLGYGWHFRPCWSSNSTRKPRLFDWTGDPKEATADVAVYMGAAIREGIGTPGRKVAWLMESPAIDQWQNTVAFLEENLDVLVSSYEWLLTSDRSLCRLHPRIVYHPSGSNLPWICENRYAIYRKTKLCSMFATKKTMVDGQRYRQTVAERLKHELDLYGGACGSPRIGGTAIHPDKSDGLVPYMFHVVLENTVVDFYYSEKITDCFATGTVPIYLGSDSIGELFDPEGILRFDDDFEVASLSAELYYEMMPAIRNNFRLVQRLEGSDDLLYRRFVRGRCPEVEIAPWKTMPPPRPRGGRSPAAEAPWQPWDVDRILACRRVVDANDDERLRVVTMVEKKSVRSLTEVPADRVSVREVTEALQPPRSSPRSTTGWSPRLTTAFLLHLPDAFIGDNAVFDHERYYGLGRWWLGSSWRLYAGTREVRHAEAAVSIGAWGGEAFQHFVFDALPPLAAVIDLLETPEMRHVKIVSHNEPGGAARWFWRRLGLSDRIVSKPRNAGSGFVIHADLVLFPQFEPNLNQLGLYPRGVLRPIQRRLGVMQPVEPDLVVYLRRQTTRSVADEDRLLARVSRALDGSGLKLHVLEEPRSPGDAEPWIKRAKVVFGPHGGAFGNLVFAQPGTRVVEFVPGGSFESGPHLQRLSMYYGLSQAAGLDYWFVEPANFQHQGCGMHVDADEVAEIVRGALAS